MKTRCGPLNIGIGIGIVGVGNISAQYFADLPKLPGLGLVAVADIYEARTAEHSVEALSVDVLLASELAATRTIP